MLGSSWFNDFDLGVNILSLDYLEIIAILVDNISRVFILVVQFFIEFLIYFCSIFNGISNLFLNS